MLVHRPERFVVDHVFIVCYVWVQVYSTKMNGFDPFFCFFSFCRGTSGIDIDLRRVDIDQCPQMQVTGTTLPLNIFAGTDKCKQRTTEVIMKLLLCHSPFCVSFLFFFFSNFVLFQIKLKITRRSSFIYLILFFSSFFQCKNSYEFRFSASTFSTFISLISCNFSLDNFIKLSELNVLHNNMQYITVQNKRSKICEHEKRTQKKPYIFIESTLFHY